MTNFTRFLCVLLVLLGILLVIDCLFPIGAFAYEETLYVMVTELNGRECPNTKCGVEAHFERGDMLAPIQLNTNGWVEVIGGETGTVWCKAEYVSESESIRKWKNTSGGSVNLRANPSCEAKKIGKIKHGRVMRITAEVMGWGYIKDQGWVDLEYFELVETDE